jgi:hypothetical protein
MVKPVFIRGYNARLWKFIHHIPPGSLQRHPTGRQRRDSLSLFHGVEGDEQHAKYFNIIEASIVRDYCVKLIEDREPKICKNGVHFGSTGSNYCFPVHIARG